VHVLTAPIRRSILAVLLLAGLALPFVRPDAANALPADRYSIGDVGLGEGTADNTLFQFPVTIHPANQTAYGGDPIDWSTSPAPGTNEGATCTPGVDYIGGDSTTAPNDTLAPLVWAPGDPTTKTIDITVCKDAVAEPNELFTVTLSSTNSQAFDGPTGRAVATGEIQNDDAPPPKILVNDPTVTEGDNTSTTTDMTFNVTLDGPSTGTVSVKYAVTAGTATSSSDYTPPAAGTLTYSPGQNAKAVVVKIKGDTFDEPNETVLLNLSEANNAVLNDTQGVGTITDDDGVSAISIAAGPTVAEATSATATFSVSLFPASGQTVKVNYTTQDGTAVAGQDYVAKSGQLVFPPNTTAVTAPIDIIDDNLFESNENFKLVLSSPQNATLTPAGASIESTATITSADPAPNLNIIDATALEGTAAAPGKVQFTVSLSVAQAQPVTFKYTTVGVSAEGGKDYTTVTNAIATIPANQTTILIDVNLIGDNVSEATETFTVNLSAPTNAAIQDGSAIGTITDNDTPPVFSVGNVATAEGNSGSTVATFPVTLSAASGQPTKINYTTANADADTAKAGTDYAPASGQLVIPTGSTAGSIAVTVFGDAKDEVNEGYKLVLTGAAGTTPGSTATALGTITDDDTPPTISIADIQLNEGTGSTSNATFTVTLSAPSGRVVTVKAATADDTAVSTGAPPAQDYVPRTDAAPAISFPEDSVSQTFAVTINGDSAGEEDEAFKANLTAATGGATIADAQAIGTILDDDGPVPLASVTNVSGDESDGLLTFTITLSSPPGAGNTITVDYTTATGTATQGVDYTLTTGTATFTNTATSKPVTVPVVKNDGDEDDEKFTLNLSNALPNDKVKMGTATATGTILDSDPPPTVTVAAPSPATVDENDGPAVFTINLSAPSSRAVTVNYKTTAGTATEGTDYTKNVGNVVIPANSTSAKVNVAITDDPVDEDNETFSVDLLSATNGTLATTPTASITIVDNEPTPSLTIGDVTVAEGDAGNTSATFTATLSTASARTVTATYQTADDTAKKPSDYTEKSGTVTFDPGETTQVITVVVIGDTVDEPDETFGLNLSNLINAVIGDVAAVGTINNDDGPDITINSVTRLESAGTATFNVTLAAPSTRTITVDYAFANGTADKGADFTGTDGTLTFTAGQVLKEVVATVKEDALDEVDETFFVNLSNPSNAPIGGGQGVGTITDNDATPTLTIANAAVQEGDSGTTSLGFDLTLSAPSGRTVTVQYGTTDGSATAPADYTGVSGTVSFAPGDTDGIISVAVKGDTLDEANETLTLALSNPQGVILPTPASVTGTINDNDATPSLSMADVTIKEPVAGTASAVFNVVLSAVSGQTVTVKYATANGTATSADYTPSSGTLTIPAGSPSGTIAVPVNADAPTEANETFLVNLSGPVNAQLPDAQAVGTITDTPAKGYWLTGQDGGIFNYGDAPLHGAIGGKTLNAPVVGMTATPDRGAYWQVASDGGVFAYPANQNKFFGSKGGQPLNKPVVGMAATPTGLGYWLVASDGGIFSYGDAAQKFFGSMGGKPLNAPIVGMAVTRSGLGYWLVASDGGIFAFGDAEQNFFGSMGGKPINSPIVGMAVTKTGKGYFLVALDGGVFAFGDAVAAHRGSAANRGVKNIVGMHVSEIGVGYRLAGSDGAIYVFGDAADLGSPKASNLKLFAPVSGVSGF
jgi:hypothetical protein